MNVVSVMQVVHRFLKSYCESQCGGSGRRDLGRLCHRLLGGCVGTNDSKPCYLSDMCMKTSPKGTTAANTAETSSSAT